MEFIEEGHKYFLHGKPLPSVSSVVHKFEEPFDADMQAAKYAEKHGETAQYWLDQWKFNNLRATTTGTLVHAYGESLGWLRNGHPELITEDNKCKYIADKNWLIPTRPKEEAVLKFYDNLPQGLHFVLAETKVYSNKSEISTVNEQFCGTFDLLMYYDDPKGKNSGIILMDFKTNASLSNSYSRQFKKMLLPPFDDMCAEPLSVYRLQLSLYSLCLRGIGLDTVAMRLIWLKDDGNYELIPLDDMSKDPNFKLNF